MKKETLGSIITSAIVISIVSCAMLGVKPTVKIQEAKAAEIPMTEQDKLSICSLEDVICDNETKDSMDQYDITPYATNPSHEKTVKAIYDAMPEIKDKFDADAYIKARRPNSPIRGGMVERASQKYGVDMKLVLALMQNDSSFGTSGLGARTRNPGNIANRDDGHTFTYGSWELGVEGVARWLSKHRTN